MASPTRKSTGRRRQTRSPAPSRSGPPTNTARWRESTLYVRAVPRAMRPAATHKNEAPSSTRFANQRAFIRRIGQASAEPADSSTGGNRIGHRGRGNEKRAGQAQPDEGQDHDDRIQVPRSVPLDHRQDQEGDRQHEHDSRQRLREPSEPGAHVPGGQRQGEDDRRGQGGDRLPGQNPRQARSRRVAVRRCQGDRGGIEQSTQEPDTPPEGSQASGDRRQATGPSFRQPEPRDQAAHEPDDHEAAENPQERHPFPLHPLAEEQVHELRVGGARVGPRPPQNHVVNPDPERGPEAGRRTQLLPDRGSVVQVNLLVGWGTTSFTSTAPVTMPASPRQGARKERTRNRTRRSLPADPGRSGRGDRPRWSRSSSAGRGPAIGTAAGRTGSGWRTRPPAADARPTEARTAWGT